MAQLSNDCFRPGEGLIPLDDALAALDQRLCAVVGTETAALNEACGRVLAVDITTRLDVPPHDNSAVDGYAVRFEDLDAAAETRLPVKGRIAAGHPLKVPAEAGCAYRIFTGAPMPDGFDTVFMQEDCTRDGDAVILPAGLKQGANRRHRGEDVAAGAVILKSGRLLRPSDVGLSASVGIGELKVFKPLRAAVFSTGDEIYDPSERAPEGGVFDANRYAVSALLRDLGCRVTDLGIITDDMDAIRDALAAAAPGHDLILTSGGVSTGDEDHVKAAVEAAGSIHFWRLAIKPGRPIALGQIRDAVFIGLPGNPAAAMVTFMRIARPLILKLSGRTDPPPALFPVRAGFSYKKKSGRREWVRAKLVRNGQGVVAEKFPVDGAGILTSMVESDGLVELPEDMTTLEEGAEVNFLPFSEVGR